MWLIYDCQLFNNLPRVMTSSLTELLHKGKKFILAVRERLKKLNQAGENRYTCAISC